VLEDNVNELMKALRYLADVVDKGVVNKGVLCMLPQSVTMIVDMVTELSRVINSTVNNDTYVVAYILSFDVLCDSFPNCNALTHSWLDDVKSSGLIKPVSYSQRFYFGTDRER